MLRQDSNLEPMRRRPSCAASEHSSSSVDPQQRDNGQESHEGAMMIRRIIDAAASGKSAELGRAAEVLWAELRMQDGGTSRSGALAAVPEQKPLLWQEEQELLMLVKTCASTAELMTYKLLDLISSMRHEKAYWKQMQLYPLGCRLQQGPAHCCTVLRGWLSNNQQAGVSPVQAARETVARLAALEQPVAAVIGRLNHSLNRLHRLDDAPYDMIRRHLSAMTQQLHMAVQSRVAWWSHGAHLLEPNAEKWDALCSLAPKAMHSELYKELQASIEGMDDFVKDIQGHFEQQPIPSHYHRNWHKYAAGAWCVTTSAMWLWSHSSYNGSVNLSRWREKAADNWKLFVTEHLQEPLTHIYNEVFGGEYQTVSDPRAVAESRRYLSQMLFDFGRLHLTPADIAAGEEKLTELRALSEAGDMTVVMEQYLTEVQRPLIGAVSGYLPQMLLIQVQKLKLDVEREMLGIEKLMRENELNLQLMATVPACMLLYGAFKSVFWTISTMLHRYRRRNDESHIEISASLQQLEAMLNAATGHCRTRNSLEDYMQMSHTEHGQVLGFVFELQIASVFVHPRSEREKFVESLALFKNPSYSPAQLLRACDHMYAQYPFLQQSPASTFW